jgi:hypothetical protein
MRPAAGAHQIARQGALASWDDGTNMNDNQLFHMI